ncbi:mitogen-activated protein kinase kinase kinase YODA-like protein [Tanacetum coccineum]
MTFCFIQAIEHGNASTYGALLGSMRNAIRSAKCDMVAGGGAVTSLLSMLLTGGSLTGGLGGGRFSQLYYMFSSDVELSKFPSSSIGTIQEAYDVLLKQANNKTVPTSPKRRPVCRHMATLQIPQSGAFFSALDSSRSSPSRSPMRASGPDPTLNYGFCHNSGHNSFGGDMSSAQLFWQHSRLPFDDRKLDTAVVDPLAAEEGPVAKRPHKDLGLSSEENVVTDSSLAKNVEEGPVPKCPRKDLGLSSEEICDSFIR